MEQVNDGKLKSYSIAGSATKVENVQKGLVPYMRVDDMELAEVTVCEKGVNQSASFDLLKAEEDEEEKEEIKKELPKIKKELFFKSDDNIDFLTTFVNYNDTVINKAKDPLTANSSFTTLHNYTGRVVEHHRLLNEMKFPSEQPMRAMRYTPTVYGETDEKGNVINPRPPGQVNEAGQHLGDRLDESAPSFHMSDKNKARKRKGTISITKFLDFQKASKKRNKKSSGMKNLAWATGVLAALATRITPKYNPETASFEWN